MKPVPSSVFQKQKNIYQHAATFCLLAPFIGYAITFCTLRYLLTHLPQSRLEAVIHVLLEMAPVIVGCLGFVFGIIALFGIRRHGSAGILWKALAGFLIFLVVGILASQSFHEALVEISWQPPTILAQKIVEADRVIISRERENSISNTGDEAKKIINAVSCARRDGKNHNCIFDGHLEFYGGTNLLATVRWAGHWFLTDEGQFSDNSGVLSALYHKFTIAGSP
jgi:hypothetical protein